MTERDINQHLKNGISEIAPNCLEDIMEKISSREEVPNPVPIHGKWSKKRTINCIVSMAACFTIFVGSYGFYQYDKQKITTIVELDVNPSIEFCVDKSDKVVEVQALNGDGEEIVENLSLEKEELEEATIMVMDELVKQGFITKDKSTVLVSVENDNENKNKEIKENLSKEIKKHLEKEDIHITVLKQTMVKDETSENIAKEYNISNGKALLVKTIVEKNSDLKEEELAKMTVDEIAKQANKGNVDLKKLLDEQGETVKQPEKDSKNNTKEVNVTKTAASTRVPEGGEKPETVLEGNGKEKPANAPENSRGEAPVKVPEGNNQEKPEKIPESDKKKITKVSEATEKTGKVSENDKKKEPTKTPENNKKEEPTKAPESGKKEEPTKAPESGKKEEPTKAPEADNKEKPTKAPESGKQEEPTKAPEDDKKEESVKGPEEGKKEESVKGPEDGGKEKPEKVPDGGKKVEPTKIPEQGGKGKPTEIPDSKNGIKDPDIGKKQGNDSDNFGKESEEQKDKKRG